MKINNQFPIAKIASHHFTDYDLLTTATTNGIIKLYSFHTTYHSLILLSIWE